MKKITLLFVLFSCIGYAQNDTFDGRILSLKDGGSITIGEDLKIGKGTKDNGYFRYIEVNAGSMFRSDVGQDANAMSSKYNDLKAKIIRIQERGSERTGKKFYAIISLSSIRYQVDISNALLVGEIYVEGSTLNRKTNQNNGESKFISKADELLKIKSLKDEGIITEEEFNKLKAEILSK